jgi:hypothetical protein
MKTEYLLKILVLWMVILVPVGGYAEDLGALRLGQMAGDIQIQSKGADEWFPAAINLPLQAGDRLWVPKEAWAQVETLEGSVVRLDAESALEILAVEKDSLQMYLSQGQVYLNFIKKDDFMIQVDTPVASIRVYDSSAFNVALAEDGNTDISVFRGAVYAENRSGEVRVGAGKMLSMGDDLPSLMALGPPSEWERWNKDWDEALADVEEESVQYLPQELSVYGGDLNRNGRWIETSEYGYVWTPTVYISADWAPYRDGRWVWIGDDYVWIAHEPWGWAPYHYGRWAHISSHGWCWVPPPRHEVYWGPGYVNWVATENEVAWVPLAPAEMYYGHGYYGPHSINIANININTVRVPGVNFRNVHVRDAVTVIPRDTFLTGRHHDVGHHQNPFLRERIHIGRPSIDPGRINKMPAIRNIPREHQPPAHIRSFPGRTLEGARPIVRERDRSIFTPTAAPRTLTPTIRMSPDSALKKEEAQKAPGFGGRRQIPEQNVTPGQFRRQPPIDREALKSAPSPATVRPQAPTAPAQGRPVRDNKNKLPVIREQPQIPEQNIMPRQFRGQPPIDREALKSAPPVPGRPVIREQPQIPEQNVMPRQYRSRPAVDRETVRPAPATMRPQAPPAPAPVRPVIQERPQMPEQNVMPQQFRGRPAIDRGAVRSAPPPAFVRPQNVPPPVNIRPQNMPPPAPARPYIAPPPAHGPGQAYLDAEALKRLKKQQAADKK